MAVTPQDVKKLRDMTGAGMLDCKNALIEANEDFAKAEKLLKEKGLASADKRSGRATNQGAVFSSIVGGKAAMVELTCETDFVAKNEKFRSAGKQLVDVVVAQGLLAVTPELETIVKEAISILKENMTVGRVLSWDVGESDVVVDYLHNGGQIGVMIKLVCDSPKTAGTEEVKALAFDLALHVAAYNPAYLDRGSVDPAYIQEQEEIFTKQAENMGKPEKIIQGIVKGKLNKHLSQICFVDQGFVKEDKKSVQKVVAEVAKAVGGTVNLVDYAYMAIGQEA